MMLMPDGDRLNDIAFDFPKPAEDAKEKALTLWATYYYVHSAKATSTGQPLLDKNGRELGPKLSVRDFCLAAIEGTVRVMEEGGAGVLYNYAGRSSNSQCDCSRFAPSLSASVKAGLGKTLWEPSKGPFGTGAQGMLLVPYRSIAVDPNFIPHRSVIYLPQARGVDVTLPSGRVAKHDGYFFAADTGGAIKHSHIDVFCGVSSENPFKDFVTSKPAGTFEAFQIKDDTISSSLAALHRKP
jgi:3D (Asp-Asp-Asp) domain-containing protein